MYARPVRSLARQLLLAKRIIVVRVENVCRVDKMPAHAKRLHIRRSSHKSSLPAISNNYLPQPSYRAPRSLQSVAPRHIRSSNALAS